METQEITQDDWDAAATARENPGDQLPAETPPVEDSQTAPKTEEVVEDPYAGLSPAVKAKLEQLDALAGQLPQLMTGLKETAGRVGSLQSQWAKHQQQAAAAQPTPDQIATAAQSLTNWNQLKEQYPEWGAGIEELVSSQASKGLSPEQVEQTIAAKVAESEAQLARQFNERLVAVKHPQWKADTKTPEFAAWLTVQEDAVKQRALSDDPLEAIALMDGFYEHKRTSAAAVQQSRQAKLASAAAPAKAGTAGTAPRSVEDMTDDEVWAEEAKRRRRG